MDNTLRFVQDYLLIIFITITAFNFCFNIVANNYEMREIIKKHRQRILEKKLKKLNKKKDKIEKEETLFIKFLSKSAQFIDSPIGTVLTSSLMAGTISYQLFKNPRDYYKWYAMQTAHALNSNEEYTPKFDKPMIVFWAGVGIVSSIICYKFLEWTLKPYQERENRKKTFEKDIENTSKKIKDLKNSIQENG